MERTKRKFNGKVYLWVDLTKTKREAKQVAKELRKKGQLARITKGKAAYNIWARKV